MKNVTWVALSDHERTTFRATRTFCAKTDRNNILGFDLTVRMVLFRLVLQWSRIREAMYCGLVSNNLGWNTQTLKGERFDSSCLVTDFGVMAIASEMPKKFTSGCLLWCIDAYNDDAACKAFNRAEQHLSDLGQGLLHISKAALIWPEQRNTICSLVTPS